MDLDQDKKVILVSVVVAVLLMGVAMLVVRGCSGQKSQTVSSPPTPEQAPRQATRVAQKQPDKAPSATSGSAGFSGSSSHSSGGVPSPDTPESPIQVVEPASSLQLVASVTAAGAMAPVSQLRTTPTSSTPIGGGPSSEPGVQFASSGSSGESSTSGSERQLSSGGGGGGSGGSSSGKGSGSSAGAAIFFGSAELPSPYTGFKSFSSTAAQGAYLAMMDEITAMKAQVRKESRAFALKCINDPNFPAQSQEVYRLKILAGLNDGHEAMEAGDYFTALKKYAEAVKDPNASPISKYLCYDYMLECAATIDDIQMFILIWREQAAILGSEDLEVLGINAENGRNQRAGILEMVEYLGASTSPKKIEELIEAEARSPEYARYSPEERRAKAEERVKEEIAEALETYRSHAINKESGSA